MTPERWTEIDRVWHAVLARPERERAAAIVELCAGDAELQAEIESLLANLAQASAAGFGAAPGVASDGGSLIGCRLGSYTVNALLGIGGMGEVYQAHDSTLGRDVALKILPDLWLGDRDRRARFDREARLLASLNHPNIGAIYGLHESLASSSDGLALKALVLELVDGDTLADRIVRHAPPHRGLPIDEVTTIATQIIDALEAAHERGIVHRDLKPGNIKVTPDGRVKVLDFGLACAVSGGSSPALAHSPTVTAVGTRHGVLLGTAAYMSPEQARGRAIDRRTDIWAFGCVLYEMLTGRSAFGGDGVTDVLANVIKGDADWTALPRDTPPALRVCVERCLQKDLRQRFHDIADVRLAMEGAFAIADADRRQSTPSTRLSHAGWVIAALTIAGAGAIMAFSLRAPAEPPETRLEIVTPPAVDPLSLAMSPDGRSVAFQAGQDPPRLWLRTLDSEVSRPLPGTEGAQFPFWSPDGRSVGFAAGGALKRIDLASGLVRTLAGRGSVGGSWSPSGTILIGSGIGPLFSVSADGGPATQATELLKGQVTHRWPQFLPDGERFLLYTLGVPNERGVYLGSLGDKRVQRISDRESGYGIRPPSHVLFARQGALWARPFSRNGMSLDDGFLPVAAKVLVHRGLFGYSAFSASASGSIAYRASAGETQLVWLDRTGRRAGMVGQADDSQLSLQRLSADGRTVAVTRTIAGNTNVWLLDTERGVPRRLTFGVNDVNVAFSPDGSRIVHQAEGERDGSVVWERRADGTGNEAKLLAESVDEFSHPQDWSPDGRYVVYTVDTTTNPDLRALPLFGDKRPVTVSGTPFAESNARLSPNGHWVAFQSDETGRSEIHIQPFPGLGPKVQVSVGGGTLPRWNRDGRELFYLAPDNRLMAVSVSEVNGRLDAQSPRALFTLTTTSTYEPSPDGQRFLVTAVVSEASPITVILNWKPTAR
jgi:serine/threonine protein kinase/Tol biopolymer transport system component